MPDPTSERYDAIIVGGGPAGSTCARFLVRGGARVAIVDRAEFPRVKLCGGWLSRADLGRARARAARISRAACGSGTPATCTTAAQITRSRPRLVHPPLSSSTTSCCARAAPTLHLGVSVKDIARATASGHWPSPGCARVPDRRRRHALPGGAHARAAAAERPGGRAGARVPRRCARGRARAPRARRRARAAAARRSARLRLERPEDRLAQRRRRARSIPNEVARCLAARARRTSWPPATSRPRPSPSWSPGMKGHSYYLFDPAHLDGAARVDADGARRRASWSATAWGWRSR